MLNKTVLIGRLTKDPDMRKTQSGRIVASFTLAVDRNFRDSNGERGVDFIPIVAWSKTAELCGEYLQKGNQTAISGRIQIRSYDADDGNKRYVTEVIAEEVTFLGSKNDNNVSAQLNLVEDDDEDLPF